MALIIPYTFTAGTKAKAGEVNDNFTAVKAFVDLLETNQASDEVNIATLQTGKADINGSFTERFQVADAVNTMDAVNKETMDSALGPAKGFIDGFVLSIQSNTSISATSGSCYDSTKTVVLSSATALTAEQTNLASSGTYYLYVAGDSGSGIQLLISLSSVTPTLPSGYSYYRGVGYAKTDSNAHFTEVTSYNNSSNITVASTFPNYANMSARSAGTTYTESKPGYIYGNFYRREGNAESGININGVGYPINGYLTNREGAGKVGAFIPMPAGVAYYTYGWVDTLRFIPAQGG
jgi:hypothetical protein